MSDETRITDPSTGGQKGQKQAQLGALDPRALLETAKVAGFGTEKYDRYNFARGYKWSLSYDAMQRHLLAFWDGEDRDPESGLHHLAHAAWHCMALMTFSLRNRGTDDRLNKFLAEVDGELTPADMKRLNQQALAAARRRGIPDYEAVENEIGRCNFVDSVTQRRCIKPVHSDRVHNISA